MRDTSFFSDFFVIEDPSSKKNFRGQISSDIAGYRLSRSEVIVDKFAIRYLEGAEEPSAIFWNRSNDPFCVSNEVLNILTTNGITGWSSFPVSVEDKNGKAWDCFSALTIHGRADAINYLESDIVFKQMPGGPSPSFKGLYFTPESWDGSDLFMTRADQFGKTTAFMYATKKLVQVFRKEKTRNIRFVNFNDYELWCPIVLIGANDSYRCQLEDKIAKAGAKLNV